MIENKTKLAIGVVIVFLLAFVAFNSFQTIRSGEVGLKVRFGKIVDTKLDEGLNLKIPFIEKIVTVNIKVQKVELQTEYLSTVYPKTTYRYTSSLAKGAKRTISSGSSGCKTATYKILYDKNGNFISKEQISTDIYSAHDAIVEVGS